MINVAGIEFHNPNPNNPNVRPMPGASGISGRWLTIPGYRPSSSQWLSTAADNSHPARVTPPAAGGSVRALDAGDFAEQSPAVLIDDHHAVLPRDKKTMIRRIRDYVIPTSVTAQSVGVGHVVRREGLCEE